MPRQNFYPQCIVTCKAKVALGVDQQQLVFPNDPCHVITGTCLRHSQQGRGWIVKWTYNHNGNAVVFESKVSTRMLVLVQSPDTQPQSRAPTPSNNSSSTRRGGGNNNVAVVASNTNRRVENEQDAVDDEDEARQGTEAESVAQRNSAAGAGNIELNPHRTQWDVENSHIVQDTADLYTRCPEFHWQERNASMEQPILQYFLRLYPDHLDETLRVTNAKLLEHDHATLNKQEYFMFLALHMALAHHPKRSIESMLRPPSTFEFDLDEKVYFNKYMSYERYNAISAHLSFTDDPASDEVYGEVQPLVDAFNKTREKVIKPGRDLCVDESFSPWKPMDRNTPFATIFVTVMKGKPKGIGMMIKNIADVETGIMYSIEIAATSAEMERRQYNGDRRSDGGKILHGTGYCLRLSANLHGSGRVLYGDSAFASFICAHELRKVGLHLVGHVKQASRHFPQKYLRRTEHYASRGEHKTVSTTIDGSRIIGIGWNEGKRDTNGQMKPKTYISTCFTTSAGEPHRKKRIRSYDNGTSESYYVSVPRPDAIAQYHNCCQAIDVHNHLGQGSLALEGRRAGRWQFRFWQTIMRFTIVDTYYAYKHFCPLQRDLGFPEFIKKLKHELANNVVGQATGNPYRHNVHANVSDGGNGRDFDGGEAAHVVAGIDGTSYAERCNVGRDGGNVSKPRLRCRQCKKRTTRHCFQCTEESGNDSRPSNIVALCDPMTSNCFVIYPLERRRLRQQQHRVQGTPNEDTPPPRRRARLPSPQIHGS